MKSKLFAGVAAMLAVVGVAATAVPSAGAAGRFEVGNAGYVKADETVDSSVYMAGNTERVEGTVNGDVYCAGQDLVVNGTVNGDVICGGMNITINGKVTGDVRVAGSAVTLGAEVGGSVTAFGATVTLETAGKVGRDMVVGAETVLINGSVGRDFVGGGSNVTLNGPVTRDVQGEYESLTIGNEAAIGGVVHYSSAKDAVVNGKVTGEVKRFESEAYKGRKVSEGTSFFVNVLMTLGWVLVTALALLLLLPKKMRTVTSLSPSQALLATAIGMAAIIGLPIIALFLMVSVIGLPLGVALILVWLTLMILSVGVTAIYLGRQLMAGRNLHPIAATMLGGLVIVALLVIPFINVIASILAVSFGVGAMLYAIRGEHEGNVVAKKPNVKLAKKA